MNELTYLYHIQVTFFEEIISTSKHVFLVYEVLTKGQQIY
jgi:hypothetical protein